MVSIKIFVSDEGFGHIVRQKAVINELCKIMTDVKIVFQTEKHLEEAKRFIGDKAEYSKQFHNIMTIKNEDGSLNIEKTYEFMKNYPITSKKLVEKELKEFNYDFVISDFVPEAFLITKKLAIKNCGVAHFTWDWFFSRLYPNDKNLLETFSDYLEGVDEIFFPPLTPDENLERFSDKAKRIPFIVRKDIERKRLNENGKFKVLIIDSGTGALSHIIRKNLQVLTKMEDISFYLSPLFETQGDNIHLIPKFEDVPKFISQSDLIVARAGFNTATEAIVSRVPMLLVEEKNNPEIEENIRKINELGLCGKLTLEMFANDFKNSLEKFIKEDYNIVKKKLDKFKIKTNGAEIVAKEVKKRIES